MKRELRVASWNVNGLRACARKGFGDWFARADADIVGLQEVRALPEEVPPELCAPRGWHVEFAPAERRGYSGVALYSRRKPDSVERSLGIADFDVEGRLLLARFGRLVVANAYFPKGSGRDRDNSRVPYKPARPRDNHKTSGFLPEERAEIDRWIAAGWVDVFRSFVPEGGHYSWWSQRLGARERNIGWRIDYVLASPAAARFATCAWIARDVLGSDHCPVGVDLDPAVLG
jgi:exodeoxyribonuclease-3